MPSIGTTELIVIAAIIFFLFGGKKIPEFFKGIGDAIKEFKSASRETKDEDIKKE